MEAGIVFIITESFIFLFLYFLYNTLNRLTAVKKLLEHSHPTVGVSYNQTGVKVKSLVVKNMEKTDLVLCMLALHWMKQMAFWIIHISESL